MGHDHRQSFHAELTNLEESALGGLDLAVELLDDEIERAEG